MGEERAEEGAIRNRSKRLGRGGYISTRGRSVVVCRGEEDCGLDSGTRRITTRNERNPCQWTSFAFPIFIVPALNSRRASCFPSVARERQGRDCSIYLELRNSSYHLVVFFPLFLLLFYPSFPRVCFI